MIENLNLGAILSQPFTFLGEGLQVRVYLSEDNLYVLKLSKTFQEAQQQFEKWGKDPNEITLEWFNHDSESYKLSSDKLQTETALLYVHLPNESAPTDSILLDGVITDTISSQFILQEKVELVRDRIKKLMDQELITEAQKVINDVLSLITQIWDKGITEDTFNFDHNYGYTNEKELVQVDIGSFWEGSSYIKKELVEKKLLKCDSFEWLKDKHPSLEKYYLDSVNNLYTKYEQLYAENN